MLDFIYVALDAQHHYTVSSTSSLLDPLPNANSPQVLQRPKPHGPMARPNVRAHSLARPHTDTAHSPYYVFLGCSRSRSTARAVKAFEIESGNTAGSGHITPLHSPALGPRSPSFSSCGSPPAPFSPVSSCAAAAEMPELELGPAALAGGGGGALALPLSSFHYQTRFWRLPFLEQRAHGEFRSWIYGFTVRCFSMSEGTGADAVRAVGGPRGRYAPFGADK